jgi:hypothetical protein
VQIALRNYSSKHSLKSGNGFPLPSVPFKTSPLFPVGKERNRERDIIGHISQWSQG